MKTSYFLSIVIHGTIALGIMTSCASGVKVRRSGEAAVRTTDETLLPKSLLDQYTLTAQDVIRVAFTFGNSEYHLMPGDLIKLNFNTAGLTDESMVIRPDGRITLPDNGEVMAAGKTPLELANEVNAAYEEKVLRSLKTSVSVTQVNQTLATQLNGDYTIRPDGILALPYLGEIPAAGRSTKELIAELTVAGKRKFNNDLEASIVVKTFAGAIFVGGEVVKPGSYPFSGGLTTLKAVLLAGGFTNDANQNDVVLIHYKTNRDITVYRTSIKQVIGKASGLNDLVLSPQDVVYVPKTGIAQAGLFVEQYINKIIPRSANVTYSAGNAAVAPVF